MTMFNGDIHNAVDLGDLVSEVTRIALSAYEHKPFTQVHTPVREIEMFRKAVCVKARHSWCTWDAFFTNGFSVEDIFQLCIQNKALLCGEFCDAFPLENIQFFFWVLPIENKGKVSVLLYLSCVQKAKYLSLVQRNTPPVEVIGKKVVSLAGRRKNKPA